MKKPKVLLSAILLIAAMATIFAVNVRAKRGFVVYTSTAHGVPCTITLRDRTLTTTGPWTYVTTIWGAPCVWSKTTIRP